MTFERDVLDRVFPHEDLPFGRRWRLAGSYVNPWTEPGILAKPLPWPIDGQVYLHHMIRADLDRDLHDHPWSFVSFILRGGYAEYLRVGDQTITRIHRPGSVVVRRAEDLHRVASLLTGEAWTLVFTGPKVRKWGFQVGALWVPHDEYRRIQETKDHPLGEFVRTKQQEAR